jgi:copper chaperone CopZ
MDARRLSLAIEGMHCGGCVNRVTNALSRTPGVKVEKVEVGAAEVEFDAGVITPEAVTEAVNRTGFSARVAG